jgi:predicted short-subunit dehydrogenase-like oxidoreductase (DUF2520 family)
MNITIVGTGRAGSSFAVALSEVGHRVILQHHDDTTIDPNADVVLLCVPDDSLAELARSLRVGPSTVVAHCAGSRTLDVLAPHTKVASIHPLVALSSTEVGALRLRSATYCVAGDGVVRDIVHSLSGRAFTIDDDKRGAYHATACVAANHLVALMGHVARLAENAGLELSEFLELAHSALDDVVSVGPELALTGPASRGDLVTIDAHLAAIPESERATYVALANAALALSERRNALSIS